MLEEWPKASVLVFLEVEELCFVEGWEMGYNLWLKEMNNKYYHNDYKKMMGVD